MSSVYILTPPPSSVQLRFPTLSHAFWVPGFVQRQARTFSGGRFGLAEVSRLHGLSIFDDVVAVWSTWDRNVGHRARWERSPEEDFVLASFKFPLVCLT